MITFSSRMSRSTNFVDYKPSGMILVATRAAEKRSYHIIPIATVTLKATHCYASIVSSLTTDLSLAHTHLMTCISAYLRVTATCPLCYSNRFASYGYIIIIGQIHLHDSDYNERVYWYYPTHSHE